MEEEMKDYLGKIHTKRINKLLKIIKFLKEENEEDFYHPYYEENIDRVKIYEEEILKCIGELKKHNINIPKIKNIEKIGNFNNLLDGIKHLELTLHGWPHLVKTIYCKIYEEGVLIFNPNKLNLDEDFIVKNNLFDKDKKTFLNQLKELNIGEWKSEYFNNRILDGTSWEFKIHFNNPKKVKKYSGINAYPYNFTKLLELLEAENED